MTTTQLQHKPAAAVKTMYLGLALTVVSALAVIIEGEDISQRLHQIEDRWLGPAKAAQSPSLVTTYLFIVAALGVAAGW